MKNKIFILIIIFFILFNSVFSYADEIKNYDENINYIDVSSNFNQRFLPLAGIAITPELVGVISTIAVATGFVILSDDDLVDLCYSFYSFLGFDKIKEHNELLETVALLSLDGLLTIPSGIVSDFKTYGDNVLSNLTSTTVSYSFGLPCVSDNSVAYLVGANFPSSLAEGDTYYINQYFKVTFESGIYILSFTNDEGLTWNKLLTINPSGQFSTIKKLEGFEGFKFVVYSDIDWSGKVTLYSKIVYNYDFTWSNGRVEKMYSQFTDYNFLAAITGAGVIDLGFTPGSFDWEKIKDKINEDGDLPLYLPKDLSDLLNNPGSSFDPTKDNVYKPGDILTFPNIDNPSLELNGTTDIPIDGVTDIPGDGTVDTPVDDTVDTPFDAIKDFIISLVVPSDAFWVDTFGGLRGSFNSAFPMVDMSNFNSLIVGGKPFPNIYITVFGSKSKIVDGDVINSIVDWLRPLIAGFMMLCLMLFNYRKIYKLIRNSEPFGPIAPGTSDFRTGMSAPTMDDGFSAYDIARDRLRDVAFDMRNEILSRKNK